MRNLKKFLALVLAFVMAMSLMVTVNASSDFTDADTVKDEFTESVEVLTGMGVIKGYDEDGSVSFKPTETVTRAEMAAFIYRIATGDAEENQAPLYAGTGTDFVDVQPGKWYDGVVGFCANNNLIVGYTNNTFQPSKAVTGIEALIMILRAVGYDQGGEFTTSAWATNAYSRAQSEGLLVNVNKTNYASTLSQPATRELVAELLFRAANIPTVTWTSALGYNKYTTLTGSTPNETLGEKNFYLAHGEFVVLGNQATGEKSTVLGLIDSESGTIDYNFPGTTYTPAGGEETTTVGLNVTGVTGVDEFAHKVDVWYRNDSAATKTSYAITDCAKSAIIKAPVATFDTTDLSDASATTIKDNLPSGWKLNDNVYVNAAFSQFNANATTEAAAVDATDTTLDLSDVNGDGSLDVSSPVDLYQIIDNDGDGKVDVIISLNIETSKIIGRNAVASVPYVGVATANTTGSNPGDDFITANNTTTAGEGRIVDAALSADSVKTLGAYEMGFYVKGTTPRELKAPENTAGTLVPTKTADETGYYTLKELTNKVEGSVVSMKGDTLNVRTANGTVSLKQSIYFDTVVTTVLPQPASFSNKNYTFYLDENGDYLGAVSGVGSSFVYATYADVSSPMGSSSFTYQVIGVDMDGNMVKPTVTEITHTKNASGIVTVTDKIDSLTDIVGQSQNGETKNIGTGENLENSIPYRDDSNSVTIEEGQYTGFAIDENGVLNTRLDDTVLTTPMMQGDDDDLTWVGGVGDHNGDTDLEKASLVLTSADVKKGVLLAGKLEDGNGTKHNVYFTEATKFIVVGGNGTDTLEPTVYTGLTGLLGDSLSVDFGNLNTAQTSTAGSNLVDGVDFAQMIYFSSVDNQFAQIGDYNAINVDTIFIPAAALDFTGKATTYYLGDNAYGLTDAKDSTVKQVELYEGTELKTFWLDTTASSAALAHTDEFVNLRLSTKTTAGGEPVYIAALATNTTRHAVYYAQTNIGVNTAFIGSTLYRIDDATIVNVNNEQAENPVWPGITDLNTLNDASSMNTQANTSVYVSVARIGTDGNNYLIYVCFNQTSSEVNSNS